MKKIRFSENLIARIFQICLVIVLTLSLITAIAMPFSEVIESNFGNNAVALSRLGSRGEEVKKIQQVLKKEGLYTGGIDGIYGNATRQAVIKFQKRCGLTADGIAGKKTLLYLGITGGSSSSGSSGSTGQYSNSDVELLAKIISAESRGEPYEGQVAVGAVVLNRVQHASFPDSISGVVYQKGAFAAVTDSNWSAPVAESSRRAAKDAINGWDPSGGAIYYFDPAKTSNAFMHSLPVIKTIGVHRFCRAK